MKEPSDWAMKQGLSIIGEPVHCANCDVTAIVIARALDAAREEKTPCRCEQHDCDAMARAEADESFTAGRAAGIEEAANHFDFLLIYATASTPQKTQLAWKAAAAKIRALLLAEPKGEKK